MNTLIEKKGDVFIKLKIKKISLYVLSSIIIATLNAPLAYATDINGISELIPIGKSVGIKMLSDGVVVSSISEVLTDEGELFSAADVGIMSGDIILSVDEKEISTNEELSVALQETKGQVCILEISRGNENLELTASPVLSEDGKYKLGIIVRDSMAGIGTVTFIEPTSGFYGSLGHGITDIESGVVMPILEGSIMPATISSVKMGKVGDPGALDGQCQTDVDIGVVSNNNSTGIYGFITDMSYFKNSEALPLAVSDEIQIGKAQIISNISGDETMEYDIEIVKILSKNDEQNRNLMIKVTDEELLSQTGGIVQGMSGSPIVQDGKLIGAVTHVLVNDPTMGYGIFIENMLESADSIGN